MEYYDVVIIGGGPAGLAAALSAHSRNARVLLIEREARLGGILKQCIHDGFGLIRFGERLCGTEYAVRYVREVERAGVEYSLLSYVSRIEENKGVPTLTVVTRRGIRHVSAKSLIFATGCRERTAKQVAIHGTRPAGVFTAGTVQYYVNVLGKLPGKRCVILGSGDVGLIMARRLTLEGAEVLGVYEAKATPGGLTRNIAQCLNDFDIPLYLSHSVTELSGHDRLSAVTIAQVDEEITPIAGTEREIPCDTLILSVGLIPENELAGSLGVELDAHTSGPYVDQNYMARTDGVFSCGNALHVNDLVDYVSESGERAGIMAAAYNGEQRRLVSMTADEGFAYIVPQMLDLNSPEEEVVLFFRSREEMGKTKIGLLADGREVFSKTYPRLKPPEMERLTVNMANIGASENTKLEWVMRNAD